MGVAVGPTVGVGVGVGVLVRVGVAVGAVVGVGVGDGVGVRVGHTALVEQLIQFHDVLPAGHEEVPLWHVDPSFHPH